VCSDIPIMTSESASTRSEKRGEVCAICRTQTETIGSQYFNSHDGAGALV
jgi:hypothetical protein